MVLIPPNYTDRLQPLDTNVNKPAMDYLHCEFKSWYAKQVCHQFKGGCEKAPINLCLSVVKLIGAEWISHLIAF